jgi:hypothetical protein
MHRRQPVLPLNCIGKLEAKNLPIEVQFRLKGATNVARHTEAMLFIREMDIRDRQTFSSHRSVHRFGLIRQNDLVLCTLEQNHCARQPLDIVDRRALVIQSPLFGIATGQAEQIVRFEFLCFSQQRLEIADYVVARAGT